MKNCNGILGKTLDLCIGIRGENAVRNNEPPNKACYVYITGPVTNDTYVWLVSCHELKAYK